MPTQDLRAEARRLYRLGFAIHWVRPRSKRPFGNKWTTGPRKSWAELENTYQPTYNVGVRLGTPSKLENGYLACIDVDIKLAKYKETALEKLAELIEFQTFPEVRSGGGNGSRHLYFVSKEPFEQITFAKSEEKVFQNGKNSHAWEIILYSTGRQMVLPPSIHPSGQPYVWKKDLEGCFPLFDVSVCAENSEITASTKTAVLEDFAIEPVDLALLDISEEVRKGIVDGADILDRSAFLLPACTALFSAGLSKNEILTVLTEPKFFLGQVGYDHTQGKSRRAAANWIWKYTLKKVIEEKDASNVFGKAELIGPTKTLSETEAKEQTAEIEIELDWRQGIARTKEGAPRSTIGNIALILQKTFKPDFIKYDDFCSREHFTQKMPWAKRDETFDDSHVIQMRKWFGAQFGFEPAKETIFDALGAIALENRYDPVKNRFDALPEWDQKGRLNFWLKEHFEAKAPIFYTAQVFRKWMVAMVMRIYCPGAKFDWMPIFEGLQGVGKSSFGRLLVGDKYFIDSLPPLSDKDAALALQGIHACEMGELATLRKNELDITKAFLTRTVDKIRPPFGRKVIESFRRCVFYGTTNRETYLRDDSGNRRFKPIVVGKLDFRALERDRDQLFAEAKYLFDNFIETEVSLELSGKAKTFEATIHQEKMVKDDATVMEELFHAFLEKDEGNFALDKFRVSDLFGVSGPLHKMRFDNWNSQLAAKMLTKIGAQKRIIKGYPFWKFEKGEGVEADF